MRSFIGPEQFPYETTTGWTYDSGNYAATMREAMRIAGYDELRREQAEKRASGGTSVSAARYPAPLRARGSSSLARTGASSRSWSTTHPVAHSRRPAGFR